jgi:aldehyde dehydrogenase (NAD+)
MTFAKITLPNGKSYAQPTGLFINNEFVKAKSGKTFDTINPATNKVICAVQEAGDEDVDIAISAARKAFDGEWGDMAASERGKLLIKFAELIEEDAENLAAVESMNGGKVLLSLMMLIVAILDCQE